MATDNATGWYETEYTHACQKLARVRAELAQAQIDKELAQQSNLLAMQDVTILRTELSDACAARDALARECDQLEADREYNASLVMGKDKELTRMRRAAQEQGAELKDLQGANHSLVRQLTEMEAGRDFWRREYGRNVKRLATLDAAEAALAHERQLRQIAETGERAARKILSQAIVAQADAELAAHLHSKALDECTQTVHTECRLRQEAERVCKAMSEMARNRGTRLEEMEQRAECTEAQLSNGHGTLTAAGVPQSDASGKLSITGRVVRLRQRAERAEALAQLVNEETAGLLHRLARYAQAASPDIQSPLLHAHSWCNKDAEAARKLAAQIKEALDEH